MACSLACEGYHILHAYTYLPVGPYLHRDLKSGATNPAGFYLNLRSDIIKSLLENLKRCLSFTFKFITDYFQ